MPTRLVARSRGLVVAGGTVVLLVLAFAMAAIGYQKDDPPLGPLLLDRGDMPHNVFGKPVVSAPVSPSIAGALGWKGDTSEASHVEGWIRVWWRPGFQLRELIANSHFTDSAVKALRRVGDMMERRGLEPFSVSGVPGAVGAEGIVNVNGRSEQNASVGFVRGSLYLQIGVTTPSQLGAATNRAIVEAVAHAQAKKVEVNYGGVVGQVVTPASVFGFTVGAVVGYFLLLGTWAYFRDPLRGDGRRWGFRGKMAAPHSDRTLDVSEGARRLVRVEIASFAVQLAGVASIAWAFVAQSAVGRVAFALTGLLLLTAVRWYRFRRGDSLANKSVFTGKRPIRVTALFISAMLSGLLGWFFIVQAGRSSGGSPGFSWYLGSAACLLAVAGICLRRARRLSAVTARRTLERDSRPMVLYLRSFGDDDLKLRSATLGRRSLIERFSPNRFDSFEETIARHLSRLGPVVAVNPPGTRLPPLGAARETLPPENWQPVVDEWMAHAALIVIGVPPSSQSPGLAWELDRIAHSKRWAQTVAVVPPVPSEQLRSRWQKFATSTRDWPATSELPAEPANILAMIRRSGAWIAITATARTEWSYAAALNLASSQPHDSASATQTTASASSVMALPTG